MGLHEIKNFFKVRSPNGKKQKQEKILTISGHKVNANQNCPKILPHSCFNWYHQEHHQHQMLARMWEKRNPHTLLLGM
jgi:hypothetical protein